MFLYLLLGLLLTLSFQGELTANADVHVHKVSNTRTSARDLHRSVPSVGVPEFDPDTLNTHAAVSGTRHDVVYNTLGNLGGADDQNRVVSNTGTTSVAEYRLTVHHHPGLRYVSAPE